MLTVFENYFIALFCQICSWMHCNLTRKLLWDCVRSGLPFWRYVVHRWLHKAIDSKRNFRVIMIMMMIWQFPVYPGVEIYSQNGNSLVSVEELSSYSKLNSCCNHMSTLNPTEAYLESLKSTVEPILTVCKSLDSKESAFSFCEFPTSWMFK